MGSVYLAQHELIDRQVAIKVLHSDRAANPAARKRFLREARAASKVVHPGVVEIHDVAIVGDHAFFVMELLLGHDLGERLEHEGRLPWPRAQPLLLQIAHALQAAHAAGVVHRDVKPSNCVLVPDPEGGGERVKVVDFGIAKLSAEERTVADELTATGEIVGTLAYLAPEQAEGSSEDPRSDVYAFGVLMFRVLTGRLPFTGSTTQVLAQHLTKPPPEPRSIEPSIPSSVERLILRCLEKKPERRPPSMQQLADALAAAAPEPAAPHDPSASPRPSAGAPSLPASISTESLVDLDERVDLPPLPPPADDHETSADDDREPAPPARDPSRFRPPPDPEFELEVERPPPPEPSAIPKRRRSLALPLLALAVLVALGTVAWIYREPIGQAVPEVPALPEFLEAQPPEDPAARPEDADQPVLLLVDTVPKDAEIYVDDVRTTERPIRVPRSAADLRIRVQAPGYESRTVVVTPQRTRRLEIQLDRTKRSR